MKRIFIALVALLLLVSMVSCGAELSMEQVVEKMNSYADKYEKFSYYDGEDAKEIAEEVFEETETEPKEIVSCYFLEYDYEYEGIVVEFGSEADAKAFVEAGNKEVDGFKWTDEFQHGVCENRGKIAILGSEIFITMLFGEE